MGLWWTRRVLFLFIATLVGAGPTARGRGRSAKRPGRLQPDVVDAKRRTALYRHLLTRAGQRSAISGWAPRPACCDSTACGSSHGNHWRRFRIRRPRFARFAPRVTARSGSGWGSLEAWAGCAAMSCAHSARPRVSPKASSPIAARGCGRRDLGGRPFRPPRLRGRKLDAQRCRPSAWRRARALHRCRQRLLAATPSGVFRRPSADASLRPLRGLHRSSAVGRARLQGRLWVTDPSSAIGDARRTRTRHTPGEGPRQPAADRFARWSLGRDPRSGPLALQAAVAPAIPTNLRRPRPRQASPMTA